MTWTGGGACRPLVIILAEVVELLGVDVLLGLLDKLCVGELQIHGDVTQERLDVGVPELLRTVERTGHADDERFVFAQDLDSTNGFFQEGT